MRSQTLIPLFLACATAGAGADDSLVHARRAQALLGAEVWSQVLHIENRARASAYPRTLHALVFELAGILWFYSDGDGTQSFSLYRGRLEQDKADYAPLLRDIEPGFARWSVMADDVSLSEDGTLVGELPNGCFIESYASLRRLVARGAEIGAPRLLSYYAESKVRRQGHTVLAYEVSGRVMVVDPEQPDRPLSFTGALAGDPMQLARAVQGSEVVRARVLPLELPAGPAPRGVFAANPMMRAEVAVR